MAKYQEESSSSFGWLLTGVVVGAVIGVLYAPKAGKDIRDSLGDYARDTGERAKGLVGRIGDRIPTRVKIAAGFGAAKAGVREAYREGKDKIQDNLS